jgi:PDZ domain-containing protein
VALFTDTEPDRPSRRRRSRTVGWIILVLAIIAAIVVSRFPAPYVIESPGPVFNTIGTTQVGTGTVPVISIDGHKTYPTSGALDMLTVDVNGDPQQPASWSDIAAAWFDPSQTVVPIDEIYAPKETVSQSNAESAAEMTDSQQQATAAALVEQGVPFDSTITVQGTVKGSPAAALLKKGDVLSAINGKTFVDSDQLHSLIAANGTTLPMTLDFTRHGVPQTARFTPGTSDGQAFLGVYLTEKFAFPFPVKIQLQDVGGPSAGMMFALGIIDKLTPGSLNGGKHVAGTGTITAFGSVGAIGGIRQKMYGARAAGAKYFLAPASNCGGSDGVRGHIPAGLTVFATSTLAQSVHDLHVIASGTGLSTLKTCG